METRNSMPSICCPYSRAFLATLLPDFFFFLSRTEVNAKAVNLCSVLWARLLRDALFLKAGLLLTVFEELSSVCKAGWEPSLTHSATV